MSKLLGTRGQIERDYVYALTTTIGSGGGSYLLLPEQRSRSFLEISTISASGVGYISMGAGEAVATLTSGAVSSIAVVNGGFNYTIAPTVHIMGGGNEGNTTFIGATASNGYGNPGRPGPGVQPQAWNPSGREAVAHAVLSGGAVNSIVVDDGGSGYICAPYVLLLNNRNDPNGCATPFPSSVATGRIVTSSNPLVYNGTDCTTSPIAVYCSTSGAVFLVKWMD